MIRVINRLPNSDCSPMESIAFLKEKKSGETAPVSSRVSFGSLRATNAISEIGTANNYHPRNSVVERRHPSRHFTRRQRFHAANLSKVGRSRVPSLVAPPPPLPSPHTWDILPTGLWNLRFEEGRLQFGEIEGMKSAFTIVVTFFSSPRSSTDNTLDRRQYYSGKLSGKYNWW